MHVLFPRHVTLDINLGDGATVVTAELDLERNADMPGADLFLDGEELKLFKVYVRDAKGKVVQFQVQYASCPSNPTDSLSCDHSTLRYVQPHLQLL